MSFDIVGAMGWRELFWPIAFAVVVFVMGCGFGWVAHATYAAHAAGVTP